MEMTRDDNSLDIMLEMTYKRLVALVRINVFAVYIGRST